MLLLAAGSGTKARVQQLTTNRGSKRLAFAQAHRYGSKVLLAVHGDSCGRQGVDDKGLLKPPVPC